MGKRQEEKFSIEKFLEMYKKAEKLIPGGSFNISFAHKEKEIDKVLEAAEGALFIIRKSY